MKKVLTILIMLLCILSFNCADKDTRVDTYCNIPGTIWLNTKLRINFINEVESVFITEVDTFNCVYTYSQNFVCFFYKEKLSTLFDSYIQYANIHNSIMTLHLMSPEAKEWTMELTQ